MHFLSYNINVMKKKKIRRKKPNKLVNFINNCVGITILIVIIVCCLNILEEMQKENQSVMVFENEIDNSSIAQSNYETCLNETFSDFDINDNIINEINYLNNDLANYNVSVKYLDPKTNFSYSYNPDKVYYAASTIKLLDALYIYDNASKGNLDLSTVISYDADNKIASSKILNNYSIGSLISLRDLVKAAITVSDNSAHDMLIEYIGVNNLKNYGKELGAGYTLVGGDNFGSIDVNDAIIYLSALNNYINNHEDLGSELQSYFVNSEQNYLTINSFLAAEKYGEYDNYYHELGIVYTYHPYLISILTQENNDARESIIRHINSEINDLQEMFYQNRSYHCYLYAFGE
jgi:beta-lactamase class A